MAPRKIEKALALAIAAAVAACFICFPHDVTSDAGLALGSPLAARLSYMWLHASVAHAALNAWCLVALVFSQNISWRTMGAAFIIAAAVPAPCLGTVPTVGLSGVCFVLLGSVALQVRNALSFNMRMAALVAVGFLFPQINAPLHAFCYAAGLCVAVLHFPLKCSKK